MIEKAPPDQSRFRQAPQKILQGQKQPGTRFDSIAAADQPGLREIHIKPKRCSLAGLTFGHSGRPLHKLPMTQRVNHLFITTK